MDAFNLLVAISVAFCLLTIGWAIMLLKRIYFRSIRFLTATVGFLGVYQGLRVLKEKGIWSAPMLDRLEDAADMVVAVLCFACVLILQLHHRAYAGAKGQLRLAKAAAAPAIAAAIPGEAHSPDAPLETAQPHRARKRRQAAVTACLTKKDGEVNSSSPVRGRTDG